MWPYLLAYLSSSVVALQRAQLRGLLLVFTSLLMAAFVGLRYDVGGDWRSYLDHLESVGELSIGAVFYLTDPGYYLLNWMAVRIGFSIWFVNVVCAVMFTAGLLRFCRRMPEPMLGLTVAVPYMVTVLAMGYTRQAAAFGILLWSLCCLFEGRRIAFVTTVAVAASFHRTAIVALPLAALAATERRLWISSWAAVTTLVLYLTYLAEEAEVLWINYVESEYAFASQGGPIRVAMNLVAALVLFGFRRHFQFRGGEAKLWFWFAVFCFVAFALVFQAPTAVDRVALYLMPIQLVVWSHLPSMFAPPQDSLVRMGIILGYGLVLWVWLNYADHAFAWIPYQFWPFAERP